MVLGQAMPLYAHREDRDRGRPVKRPDTRVILIYAAYGYRAVNSRTKSEISQDLSTGRGRATQPSPAISSLSTPSALPALELQESQTEATDRTAA